MAYLPDTSKPPPSENALEYLGKILGKRLVGMPLWRSRQDVFNEQINEQDLLSRRAVNELAGETAKAQTDAGLAQARAIAEKAKIAAEQPYIAPKAQVVGEAVKDTLSRQPDIFQKQRLDDDYKIYTDLKETSKEFNEAPLEIQKYMFQARGGKSFPTYRVPQPSTAQPSGITSKSDFLQSQESPAGVLNEQQYLNPQFVEKAIPYEPKIRIGDKVAQFEKLIADGKTEEEAFRILGVGRGQAIPDFTDLTQAPAEIEKRKKLIPGSEWRMDKVPGGWNLEMISPSRGTDLSGQTEAELQATYDDIMAPPQTRSRAYDELINRKSTKARMTTGAPRPSAAEPPRAQGQRGIGQTIPDGMTQEDFNQSVKNAWKAIDAGKSESRIRLIFKEATGQELPSR